MKLAYAIALAIVCPLLVSCLPIPHPAPSPRLIGTVQDRQTGRPISSAEVEMDGAFNAHGISDANGRFEVPSHYEWFFMMYFFPEDPGCALTVQAAGYRAWEEKNLCHMFEMEKLQVELTPN